MKSLLELIKLLYGPKAISSTLGTRTNVIRLPSGKLQRYLKEDLNIEAASDNAALNAYNEMKELVPDVAKMNDSERLIFEGNLRRLKNKLEASGLIPKPKVESEVIGMESKEKITGEDLKKLTEEKGTVNPPTTVAGQLEQSAKKLEGLGKNLEDEFVKGKKKSVSDLLDEYFSSYSTMKQIEDQGLVRAVARQIMYADLQSGKLKVPKEVEETIRGMTSKDVLDDFSQWYGFDAVENLYDNADKFYKMSSPQEAIKFLKENKYSNWEKVFQPRTKPIKEYMEPEEFRDMLSKLAYNRKGVFVEPGSEKLDAKTLDEIKTYYSKEKPEVVVNEIKRIEEGQIFNEFPEEDKKTILQTLLDLIKKGSPTIAGGVGIEYLAEKATPKTEGGTQQSLGLDYLTGMEPSEGYANGGRIGFKTGGGKKILDLIAEINKKLKGKKSMETVNPKTGEVTIPTEPVTTAERKIIDYDAMEEANKLSLKHKEAAYAFDEIQPIDIYDKIAPDRVAEVMAEIKGKDYYDLSQKQQSELYKKAQNYLNDYIKIDRINKAVKKFNAGEELQATDRIYLSKFLPESGVTFESKVDKSIWKKGDPITEENFGSTPFAPSQETLDNLKKAREMTKGMSLEEEMNMVLNQYDKSMFIKNEQGMVDVTNPQNIQKMALLLKRDFPELYGRLEAQIQPNILEDFDVTGRKPNAKGGLNYLMGF